MATSGELRRRFREAGEEELAALVSEVLHEMDVEAARQVLRNPHVDAETLDRLGSVRTLTSSYEVRKALATHPRTPRTLALRLVPTLYWRDLARLAADASVHPIVRRAGEKRILERLPALAVGERVGLARSASPGLVSALRLDPSPRVLGALLENPRLTEGMLVPLAANERAAPACLSRLARDRRWGARRAIRVALCRNPSTPVADAVRLVPSLARAEIRALLADPRVAPAVARKARERLGAGRRGPVSAD